MAEGMEEAAIAFDKSIAAETTPPTKTPKDAGGPPERLFKNVGDLEVDEESPEKGGGDDDDYEEAILYPKEAPKRKSAGDDDDEASDDGDGSEESDQDEGDDELDEEGEGEEDKEFLSQEVEVVVDGEPKKVKLKEALEGYVRTETWHKRMNELDEVKKIVSRAAQDAVQNYEYSMKLGKEIEEHLNALVPKEPNWDEEFAKNPQRARDLQKYFEQVNTFKNDMKAKLDEATKKQAESDKVQLATFAAEESRKFNAANSKNWAADPKRKGKDLQAMRRTALNLGFTEDEISNVYDSRMLLVLLKASKYDRMMAAKPKPVVNVRQKPIAPGTGSAKQRTVQRGVSSAMKRLSKTGSVEDAALVMDEIIRRG